MPTLTLKICLREGKKERISRMRICDKKKGAYLSVYIEVTVKRRSSVWNSEEFVKYIYRRELSAFGLYLQTWIIRVWFIFKDVNYTWSIADKICEKQVLGNYGFSSFIVKSWTFNFCVYRIKKTRLVSVAYHSISNFLFFIFYLWQLFCSDVVCCY